MWEEGGAPTRGQSEGCTSEGILSMMMALPAFHHLQHIKGYSQSVFQSREYNERISGLIEWIEIEWLRSDRQVLNAEQLTSPEADDPLAVVVTQSISGQPTDRELLTEDKLC